MNNQSDTLANGVLIAYNYLINGSPKMGPGFYQQNYENSRQQYYEKFHSFVNEIKNKYNAIEFDCVDNYGVNKFLIFEDNSSIKVIYGNCACIKDGDAIPSFEELKNYKDEGIKNIIL